MVLLDKKHIDNLSQLAQIEVSDDEVDHYIEDCSAILDFVNEIQSINTDNVAPLNHALDATQRLRQDKVTENNQQDTLEAICEHIDSHLYAVPKVIE